MTSPIIAIMLLLLHSSVPGSEATAGSLRNLQSVPTSCAESAAAYCHKFAECIDLTDDGGGFECICRSGYSGDGSLVCEDRNECFFTGDDFPCPSEESGGYCVNTFVHDPSEDTASLEGYKCGCDSHKGVTDGPDYDIHGPTSCLDVDECRGNSALENCGINAACSTNTYGSFYCECLTGYSLSKDEVCEEDVLEPAEDFPSAAPTAYASMCPISEVDNLLSFDDFDDGSGVAHGWQQWAVDYTEQEKFTTFLGRFDQNFEFPFKEFDIPLASQRVFVSFDFLEIDSWDGDGTNGPDTFGIKFESEKEGNSVTVDFGAFDYTIDEVTRDGAVGSISWTVTSTPIAQSPQGFLSYQDQKHRVSVEIGSDMYSDTGDMLKATIQWNLMGEIDEYVGVDNFRVVACVDTVPSSAPSSVPSLSPSQNPSYEPPFTPRASNSGPLVCPCCDDVEIIAACVDICSALDGLCGDGEQVLIL